MFCRYKFVQFKLISTIALRFSSLPLTSNFYVAPYQPPFPSRAENGAIRCVVVSDSPLRRHTLEHYVLLSGNMHLAASLCDGVEVYDFLQSGNEADLVIADLSDGGLLPDQLPPPESQAFTSASKPRWLVIEHMGNIPQFTPQPVVGRLAQPLCFGHFSWLVSQALGQVAMAA